MSETKPTSIIASNGPAKSPATQPMLNRHEHLHPRLPTPKAVLFDLDDTLISSRSIYAEAKPHMLRFLDDMGWGKGFQQSLRGQPLHYYASQRLERAKHSDGSRTFSDADIPAMVEHYFDIFEDRLLNIAKSQLEKTESPHKLAEDIIHPLDGAHDTLLQLKQRNVPIAIITNSPQKLVDYTLPKLFPDIFDGSLNAPVVIGSSRTDHEGKAGEKMVLKTLKALNISPKDVDGGIYYVGDTVDHDLDLAFYHGMTGVLFGTADNHVVKDALESDAPHPDAMHSFLHVDDHQQLQNMLSATLQPSPLRGNLDAATAR